MAKLYELSEQYRKFNEFVEDGMDNETSEDDLQMYIDTLESIEDAIGGKCENIAKFLKNINSDIDALKAESDRLDKKRKYLTNKYEGLKNYMGQMLINAGITNVKAGNFTIKFQASPSSVSIVDEDRIPEKYREVQPDKILKQEILKALKDKEIIPGAILIQNNQHLRIS